MLRVDVVNFLFGLGLRWINDWMDDISRFNWCLMIEENYFWNDYEMFFKMVVGFD